MFKKLDKLVIKAFIGPFIAVFFVTLLVLLLQFFWLWIDDFVGKGLSMRIIFEFVWYQSAALVPLALPLAVLLSSLMTFGNLGESMELVAVKSSGISLLRFMRPLFVVSLLICGVAFLFSNYIIPVAVLKSQTLLADIVWSKPSFDIQEGVFYDKIDGFSIKVGKKEGDSIVHDVIIYEKGPNNLQDNFIIANSGVMRTTGNKRFLEFNLRDGWRYQEKGDRFAKNTEFIRIGFKEYTKQFDLSSLGLQKRTSDTVNRTNHRMQSMRQLSKAIDSIQRGVNEYSKKVKQDIFSVFTFSKYLDSGYVKPQLPKVKVKKFEQLIPDSNLYAVNQKAAGLIGSITLNAEVDNTEFRLKERDLRLHKIEWHKKITLSLACLVLFLIGAPLGSIIRKGGLGTPLIFAILLFMFFFFFNTSGEKYAKENVMTAFGGMWMATLFLLPVGIFLTYKAMHDSNLMNKEFYFRSWRKIKAFFKRTG
ncbi:MAG TPA: LptF/LptG family permease [Chitinophagaceae bacterium]|jgi:lipopolysaccharide export system permease protein|nr:LptF/LptG family permease [Chitinophagaceae bacterium]